MHAAQTSIDIMERSLLELKPGDDMIVRFDSQNDWSTTEIVAEAEQFRRSYIVKTPQRTYQRNRRHLLTTRVLQLPSTPPQTTQSSSSQSDGDVYRVNQ